MVDYRSVFRPGLFKDQAIIVTGGGSGIGRCTAHELKSLGARIALIGRSRDKLEAVHKELGGGDDVFIHTCDLRLEQPVKDMVAAVLKWGLEFGGIENWATNKSCTFHTNDNSASGTFSAAAFDRFLSEGCAKPTMLFGHPQAMQELMAAHFQLGFQGSQVVNFNSGDRITPGYNFNSFVNTGIGRLQVVADSNFRRNASGATTFQADIWALRMTHNGEPFVYRITQIPFSINDLVPGCTAISFEVWKATALVIKACCAQGKYVSQFTGRIATTCTVLG